MYRLPDSPLKVNPSVSILRFSAPELAGAIDALTRIAPYKLPLFMALANGSIGLIEVERGQTCPAGLAKLGKPIIALVGDDDYVSTGPAAFPAAYRLARYWARSAIVHACGGEAAHYRLAVDAAITTGRMLLIETDSTHAEEWSALLTGARVKTLAVLPRGGVHPVVSSRSKMQ